MNDPYLGKCSDSDDMSECNDPHVTSLYAKKMLTRKERPVITYQRRVELSNLAAQVAVLIEQKVEYHERGIFFRFIELLVKDQA